MQLGFNCMMALMAAVEVVLASGAAEALHKRDAVVYVKQEVLEIVGYTSTVWVQPPPPSETPEPVPEVIETPTPTPEVIAAEPTDIPIPVVVPPQPSSEPSPTPSPVPEPEPVAEKPPTSGGSGSGYAGKATFYDAGLGSCGETHSNSDMICALSKVTMAITAGANPNLNPKCGTKIRVKSDSNPTGVIVTIVDTCPGCLGPYDLDLSPAAFDQLGNPDDGVISISWEEI